MTLSPSQAVELARLVSENKNVEIDPTGNAHRLADYILAAPPAPVAQEDVARLERLRTWTKTPPRYILREDQEMIDDAADRIERLSTDLARVTRELDESDAVIAYTAGHWKPTENDPVEDWHDAAIARHSASTKGEG